MEWAVMQSRFLLDKSEPWLSELDDGDRAHEPVPGTKTAGWLIGHLVITGDFGRRLCGLPPMAPKAWRDLFSPGTLPSTDEQVYPPMLELVSAFFSIYRDLAANAPLTPPERFAVPNPYEPSRGAFPTAGDFVGYLMTAHLGYHLGQLAVWRAAAKQAA